LFVLTTRKGNDWVGYTCLAYSLTSFLTSIGENEVIMSLDITHLFVRHVETVNLCSRIETFGIVKNIAYMVWIIWNKSIYLPKMIVVQHDVINNFQSWVL
jgi:hypothetical protein